MTITAKRGWLLILLACAAWFPTLRVGFIWDDHHTIVHNASLRSWSKANVLSDFRRGFFGSGQDQNFYRPLVSLLNRFDYTLYVGRPWGFHLTNLMLHAFTSVLVMMLLARLGIPALAAFWTAALFAVHPANAQDMILVSGRCGLMALFFSLASLLVWMKPGPGWTAVGGALFAAALFSKESAVAVPAALVLCWWMSGGIPRQDALRRFLLGGAVLFLYLGLRDNVLPRLAGEVPVAHWLTFMAKAFPAVLASFAVRAAAPVLLYSNRTLPESLDLWPLTLVAMVGFTFWLWHRRERWPFFAWSWFVIGLMPPTFTMVATSVMHDHWVYPALPGALLPAGMGLAWGLQSPDTVRRRLVTVAAFVLLTAGGLLCHWNVRLRGTDVDFFRWSARFTRDRTVHDNLRYFERIH